MADCAIEQEKPEIDETKNPNRKHYGHGVVIMLCYEAPLCYAMDEQFGKSF